MLAMLFSITIISMYAMVTIAARSQVDVRIISREENEHLIMKSSSFQILILVLKQIALDLECA